MARPNKPWFRESKDTWYCTLDGRKVSLGVQRRENAKAAQEAWHRLMADGRPEPEKAEPTVGDIVKQFLGECEGRVKPKTLRGYQDFLTPFTDRHGNLKASALTPTLAEAYSRKPEWSDSTRHDFLGTLAGAFRWAERARLIPRTPLLGLRRPPKASRGLEALVTPDEEGQRRGAATPQFRLLLETLWGTGARPGEVAVLASLRPGAGAPLPASQAQRCAGHSGKE